MIFKRLGKKMLNRSLAGFQPDAIGVSAEEERLVNPAQKALLVRCAGALHVLS